MRNPEKLHRVNMRRSVTNAIACYCGCCTTECRAPSLIYCCGTAGTVLTFENFPTSTTAPIGIAGGFNWNPDNTPAAAWYCSTGLLTHSAPNAIYNNAGAGRYDQPVSFEVVSFLHASPAIFTERQLLPALSAPPPSLSVQLCWFWHRPGLVSFTSVVTSMFLEHRQSGPADNTKSKHFVCR